jgi:hypothetical protein
MRGCAAARSNGNAPAHTELLPRGWNFSAFIVNIRIIHITKKKIFKVPQRRQVM